VDVQVFQAMMMMEALEKLHQKVMDRAKPFDSINVVLMGDFNAPPHYHRDVIDEFMRVIRYSALLQNEQLGIEQLQDEHVFCTLWAKGGDCLLQPNRMLLTCPRSCAAVGIAQQHRTQLLCHEWALLGQCRGWHAEQMQRHCAMTCASWARRPLRFRRVRSKASLEGCSGMPSSKYIPSPVYELFTHGQLSENSVGFLVLAAQVDGQRPTEVLPRKLLVRDWRQWSMHYNIKAMGPSRGLWLRGPIPQRIKLILEYVGLQGQTRICHHHAHGGPLPWAAAPGGVNKMRIHG